MKPSSFIFIPAAASPIFLSRWPVAKQIGGTLSNQKINVKYSRPVFRVLELIICRGVAPRHQETAKPSQPPTSTSNTTVSQAGFYPKAFTLRKCRHLQRATSLRVENHSTLFLPCCSTYLSQALQNLFEILRVRMGSNILRQLFHIQITRVLCRY